MRTEPPPEGWRKVRLGDLAEIVFSPVDKKTRLGQPVVRLCNYLDVYKNEYLSDVQDYMGATASPSEVSQYGLHVGDVVITKDSETPYDIGIPSVIEAVTSTLVCGYHLAIVRPRDGVHPVFLAKQLRHDRIQRHFAKEANGITRYGLPKAGVHTTPVWLPSEEAQGLIAAVLQTLDDAIRKTEQIIAKLSHVKQGLLHDLLTRGIDDNGELRDLERHPEQFKDSALGRIPKEWEVDSVGECLDHIIDYRGRTPKKLGMDWGEGEIPALSANNVRMGWIDLARDAYYGSSALYQRWMTNGDCRAGDVLITMEAPLGNVAQVPDRRRYILSQRVILVRFLAGKVLNDFAAIQMRTERFQRQLIRWSTGTTATGIQRAKLVQVPFVVPELCEQERIAAATRALDGRLSAENRAAIKLRLLKQGLMDDLLTGRVRVTNLLEKSPP